MLYYIIFCCPSLNNFPNCEEVCKKLLSNASPQFFFFIASPIHLFHSVPILINAAFSTVPHDCNKLVLALSYLNTAEIPYKGY